MTAELDQRADDLRFREPSARHVRLLRWRLIPKCGRFTVRPDGYDGSVCRTSASGDDADTNAAICGAVERREAVPVFWHNLIANCRPMAALNHVHPRPAEYWPDDAPDLAEALLVAPQKGDM